MHLDLSRRSLAVKTALASSAAVLISIALVYYSGLLESGSAQAIEKNADDPSQNPACVISQEIRELIELHNQTRRSGARCGMSRKPAADKLRLNCQLTDAAQLHSEYQNQHKTLSHRGRDGSSAGSRAREVGYQWKIIAENVANGYTTAERAHQGWLKSKGHCRNIMGQRFRDIGAARVGDYWTVMFGAEFTR